MRAHGFAVTFSMDGGSDLHQAQRRGADFDVIAANATALLEDPGSAQIAARATVVHGVFDLTERFNALRSIGFEDVGFSPVRVGARDQRFEKGDWPGYLEGMTSLGLREVDRLAESGASAFSNLVIALKKIHAGACSPYPCGAGGGYFSVASDGSWYACHRAIGDRRFRMGDNSALDTERRRPLTLTLFDPPMLMESDPPFHRR